MPWTFYMVALITLLGGVAAMSLRNLVHCVLCLILTFAGLAGLYLHLDAQFVGFAQVLVYVGAVGILIVFAVLLTRGGDSKEAHAFKAPLVWGLATAGAVLGVLFIALLGSTVLTTGGEASRTVTVRQIGEALMTRFVAPLEVMALLLTAALIGAVIIAMPERKGGEGEGE
jgi:NADH-quinone oxidoreductase subunit J